MVAIHDRLVDPRRLTPRRLLGRPLLEDDGRDVGLSFGDVLDLDLVAYVERPQKRQEFGHVACGRLASRPAW